MNIRILCLNIFILFITVNPVSIVELVKMSLTTRRIPFSRDGYMILLATVYILLFGAVALIHPSLYQFHLPANNIWYVVGIVMGPVIILIEMIVVALMLLLAGKGMPKFKLTKVGDDRLVAGLSAVTVGILEENIYRQIWITIICVAFGAPLYIGILISSIFYALNHVTLGPYVFIQKLISGILFSILYVASGFAIIVPMLAHVIQNIIVVARGE